MSKQESKIDPDSVGCLIRKAWLSSPSQSYCLRQICHIKVFLQSECFFHDEKVHASADEASCIGWRRMPDI